MTELQNAQRLVQGILAAARKADSLAERDEPFDAEAGTVASALSELEKLTKLSPRARERLAEELSEQGKSMQYAMILGGFLGNTAKTLREGPKPSAKVHSARPPILAPAPVP